MIQYDEKTALFRLRGDTYDYVFALYEGKPEFLHFGNRTDGDLRPLRRYDYKSFSPMIADEPGARSFGDMALEYAEYGRGDFRTPAVQIAGDGFISTDYRYTGHRIVSAHPEADGLPVFRGGETLELTLSDRLSDSTLTLYYTVYPRALVRRAAITAGRKPLTVRRLASFSLDLKGMYELTGLFGGHAAERHRRTWQPQAGKSVIESSRGTSSHQANPFAALAEPGAGEETGRVYGAALVYSGSFRIETDIDQLGNTRLVAGYNPDDFCYPLAAGTTLTAPETLLVFSDSGYGGMSRAMHDTVRDYLLPEKFVYAPRPIVINNWEATCFDFDTDTLCRMLDKLKDTGIDMFVLDDGWFGHRDDDRSSLGDWFLYEKKLPGGLDALIAKAKECGMRFGLWFEPEMISADSELYRAHPDWCIHTEGREPLTSRHQLVLDFSRPEVVDCIFRQMEAVLAKYDIAYIKWDMNRHLCDMPDFTTQHRFTLGMYELARRLTERFPDLFMEGCSGGGGRFDLGMLKYFPQIWCSDNTDAQARCLIQYGTSFPYPLSASSNHVSICPNHYTGRTTPFATRGAVAMLGAFGYELNPAQLTAEELGSIRRQTEDYRANEALVLRGELYRLSDPERTGIFCCELAAKDGSRARLTYVRFAMSDCPVSPRVYPKGLTDTATYEVRVGDAESLRFTGRTLMAAGIELPAVWRDNTAVVVDIIRI